MQLALLKNRSIEEVQRALLGQYNIGLKLKRHRFMDSLGRLVSKLFTESSGEEHGGKTPAQANQATLRPEISRIGQASMKKEK